MNSTNIFTLLILIVQLYVTLVSSKLKCIDVEDVEGMTLDAVSDIFSGYVTPAYQDAYVTLEILVEGYITWDIETGGFDASSETTVTLMVPGESIPDITQNGNYAGKTTDKE